jgi:hypothetical protein
MSHSDAMEGHVVQSRLASVIPLFIALAGLASCQSTVQPTPAQPPVATATPSPIATVTQAVTSTETPITAAPGTIGLGAGLTLVSTESRETLQSPPRSIEITAPMIEGPDEPRVTNFNQAIQSIVNDAKSQFQSDVESVGPLPEDSPTSTLIITHAVTLATEDLVSVRLGQEAFVFHWAHPAYTMQVVNYDLSQANVLELADLFQPGSDYLQVISDYAAGELQRRDFQPLFQEGTVPSRDN